MKITNLIATIISIATIIADVFFMFVLYTLGEAAAVLSEVGEGAEVAELSNAFNTVLLGGWIFSILVLLTALLCIKFSIFDSRGKKK